MLTKNTIFSIDKKYRYTLYRKLNNNNEKVCFFICLNPSTADEIKNDPTVSRCISFATNWGFGHFLMCNLFAFRNTNPKIMKQEIEPIGLENDFYILKIAKEVDLIVIAWGNYGKYLNRSEKLLDKLNEFVLYCLGITKENEPRHPLYLRKDEKLKEYEIRRT